MDNSYIGKTIDNRYEIVKLIGVGGMSNVYQAVDKTTGDTVAIKFMKQEFFENEELVRRFKNESKAISLLDNPNIIKVIDVNITANEKYIVVEYIDGITLKEYIERRKVLSWKETVRFTATILSAIGHAHANGIVHRDLKPQNIMLLRDGTLKIMDFGIARLSTANQHTVTDKAIGSVHYISPEQVRGRESDSRSDIYSIGIMMYEMVTGVLPFVSDTAVSVAMKQVQETPKKPSELVEFIPKGLEQIILKAIEKRPIDRYQSAGEMFKDLRELKNNPEINFHYDDYMDEKTRVVAVDKLAKTQNSKTKLKTKSTPNKKSKASDDTTEKKVKVKRGVRLTLPIMAGISCAFFVCSLIACFMIFKTSNNPLLSKRADVQLPNFVGMTENEVKKTDNKFTYNVEYVYSNEPAGTVVFQNPKPPKSIKETGKISLRISKGPQTAQLKNLSGYSRKEAESYLSGLDVNVSIIVESNKNVETGCVIKTSPEMGSIIESGSTVTLYVSTGDLTKITAKKTVPNVVGLTSLEEATRVLASNDFALGAYSYREDSSPEGTIIGQSPDGGSTMTVGTRVSLVISSGPPPAPVCDICGAEHESTDHMCSYCGLTGHEQSLDKNSCPAWVKDHNKPEPTPDAPEIPDVPEETPSSGEGNENGNRPSHGHLWG